MITKNVKLYLTGGFPVRVPVSQFDTMWQFVFTIINDGLEWTIPTGASAVLNGLKPDGNVFAFSGTISNNAVTVDCDVQMTAVAGDTICELSIFTTEGSEESQRAKVVGTANFVLAVEAAPNSTGATPSASNLDAYGAIISGELDTYFEQHPEMIEGKGLSEPIRLAILNCFQHVAWTDEHGQDYYDTLYDLLMNKEVLSITAVFDQGSAVIYDTDTLDTLEQYLTVTANYDDGTSAVVTGYTLSGTLTAGTSTVTVTYGEKTDTFTVTVVGVVLPEGYTRYDYLRYSGSHTALAKDRWIFLNDQANLSALKARIVFAKYAAYDSEAAFIGVRNTSDAATSYSAYITGTANGGGVGVWLNGVKKYTSAALSVGYTPNILVIDPKTASPAEITLNGVSDESPYSSTVTIPHGFVLFTNPIYTGASNMNLSEYVAIGDIVLTDSSGNLAGYYVPVVYNGQIGMYDGVSETFYSCSTAKYATIGNSACIYSVGSWE